jgi:uncharacterized protein (TIGR02145 family)
MKTFFTLSLHLLISSFLWAQAPQGIPYQAVMRNADGSVMASNTVDLTFMIHDGSATGTVVYQESHALTSNAQGLVSCVVGNGVVSQGNFANINWGSGAKFLHVLMGTTDLGTQQMLSVPYALYAGACDIQVSLTGDTLYTGSGNFVIIPGISAANYPAPVLGCAIVEACNYNPLATHDDASCIFPTIEICGNGIDEDCNDTDLACTDIIGCTDNSACNYDSTATMDDGSCIIPTSETCGNSIDEDCNGTDLPCIEFAVGNGVMDFDGKVYTSIIINGQEWMQQNLAVTKYRNGDPIPSGLTNTTWQNTTNGAYAFYNNDAANNTTYGKLYNWYAVNDSRGLCPTGWHVPSDAEWTTLINYMDPSQNSSAWGTQSAVAGGRMKSTTGWNYSNTGATNESGFTGLPGGIRYASGGNSLIGLGGRWWSSTEKEFDGVWGRGLVHSSSLVFRYVHDRRSGLSVRCVRD